MRVVLQDDSRGFMVQGDLGHSFLVEPKPKRPEQPVNSSPVDLHPRLAGPIQPIVEASGSALPVLPVLWPDRSPLNHIRETGHYETTPQSRPVSPLRAPACIVPSMSSMQFVPGANIPTSRAEGSFDGSAEPFIVLQELSHDEGPVTGGVKILLVGSNFPRSPSLFVRFGRNVILTVPPPHETACLVTDSQVDLCLIHCPAMHTASIRTTRNG